MVAGIVGLALAVRVVHVLQLADAPFFHHLLGDAQGYDQWARRIAAGDWLGSGVFYQAPLYPYVLGCLYSLFGRDLLGVRVAQAILGALACGLVTLAAIKWFGRRAAGLSGLLLACYAPALFFDALIQKPVLDGVLVGGLLLLLASESGAKAAQGFITGALLGLLALNRENALVLLPLVALWVWNAAGHRRRMAVAVAVLGTLLMLAPAAIRNAAVGGELHLTTSQLGPNFYIGNHSGATGTYVPLRQDRGSFEFERADATDLAEAAIGRRLRPSEVSDYWLHKGLDWIRTEPAAWFRLLGRKVLLLLNRTEPADTEDLASHAEWSFALRTAARVLHFGVLAPLALLGVWITRHRWRSLWPLYGFCVIFAFSVVAFYVLDRYRYPLVPVLAPFAGAALADSWGRWKQSGARERAAMVGVLSVSLIVCNWPLLSSRDMRALTHFNTGATLHEEGLDAQAEVEFRKALALQPALAIAHANLGGLLTAKGRHAEALVHCEDAARLDPRSPAAHVNLGVVLANLERTEEAVQAFTEGLRLDPRDAGAHYNVGRAFASLGQTEQAISHLREAIRLDPSRAAPHNTLGVLLCSRGQLDEGIASLRTAVRLDPASREAHANLEHALELDRSRR